MDTLPVEHGVCPECGYRMLPVLPLLPCGHDATPTIEPLDDTGVVYSFTRLWSGDTATVVAMADFHDGALRIAAPVLDVDTIAIGDPVRATPGRTTPYALVPATR